MNPTNPTNQISIFKASAMGFCSGVKRAVTILELAAARDGPIETLGPAVHNRPVVERLAGKGATVAGETPAGERVAVPSHGASPETFEQLARQRRQVVDTTCPIVRKSQMAARKLAGDNFFVLIYGDREHPEVRGLLGWAGSQSLATRDVSALAQLEKFPRKIGILAQTTMNYGAFRGFVREVLETAGDKFVEIRIVNTICGVTHRQQQAAANLAPRVDLMLVVGGKSSSNTRRLAEMCRAAGAETRQIETAAEIDAGWLPGKKRIGITAGASTPGWSVDEVISRIKELSP